jgi:hypothetical protein
VIHFQQKDGDFLERILSAQEKKLVFRVFKSSGDQMADVVRGRDISFDEFSKKALALCDPDRRIDDCFGRKSMNSTVLGTENIARQMKRADLPSTIGKFVCNPELRPHVFGKGSPQVQLLQKPSRRLPCLSAETRM